MDDQDKNQGFQAPQEAQTQNIDQAKSVQTQDMNSGTIRQTQDISSVPIKQTYEIQETPITHTIDIPNTPNIGEMGPALAPIQPTKKRDDLNSAPTVIAEGGRPTHFDSKPLSLNGLKIPRNATSVQPLSQFSTGGNSYTEFADGSKMDSNGVYYSDKAGPVVTANQFLTTAGNRFEQMARQVYSKLQSNNDYVKDGVRILDSNLKKLGEIMLKDAPNDLARAEFARRIADYRYRMSDLAGQGQIQAGKQEFANEIDKQSHILSSMAYRNPAAMDNLLQRSEDIAQVARQRGLNPDSVDQTVRDTRRKIQTAALNAVLEHDPKQAQALIASGRFDDLGGDALRQFNSNALTAQKQAFDYTNKQIDDAITQMKAGKYVDYNPRDLNKVPPEFREKVADYNRYQEAANRVRGSTYDQVVTLANSSDTVQADVARTAKALMESNPHQYAIDQRLVPAIPLRGPQDVAQQIQNLKTIETKNGIPVTDPLSQPQVEKALAAFKSKQPGVINQAMDLIDSFGEYRDKAVAQLAAKDPDIKLYASVRTPEDRINMIAGMNAGKIGEIPDSTSALVSLKSSDNNFGPQCMQGNPDAILPAYYIAKGKAAATGKTDFDKNKFEESFRQELGVISMKGGSPGFFGNGSYDTVPPQKGMTADAFKATLDSLTNQDIAKYGNSRTIGVTGAMYDDLPRYSNNEVVDFSKESPSSFKWVPFNENLYMLTINDKPLKTSDNKPFTVDLRRLLRDKGIH